MVDHVGWLGHVCRILNMENDWLIRFFVNELNLLAINLLLCFHRGKMQTSRGKFQRCDETEGGSAEHDDIGVRRRE